MMQSDQKNKTREEFLKKGYSILDQFLSEEQCDQLLTTIQQFRHNHPLPEIYRQARGRSLRYSVIDGEKIEHHLPEIVRKLVGKKVAVRPVHGRLVIMRGNRSLHSVRSVEGDEGRINMVFAYDAPNAKFADEAQLDTYLYTQEPVTSEPNRT